jgi:hypothetical protein
VSNDDHTHRRFDDPPGPSVEKVVQGWWDWIKDYTVRREECTIAFRTVVTTCAAGAFWYAVGVYNSVKETPVEHARIAQEQASQKTALDMERKRIDALQFRQGDVLHHLERNDRRIDDLATIRDRFEDLIVRFNHLELRVDAIHASDTTEHKELTTIPTRPGGIPP